MECKARCWCSCTQELEEEEDKGGRSWGRRGFFTGTRELANVLGRKKLGKARRLPAEYSSHKTS